MDQQFNLFDEEPARPARPPRGPDRTHKPGPGELGIPLTSVQTEIVDRALGIFIEMESADRHALPVRVGQVLHLPREMEVVADLMDILDGPTPDASWRRPSDRLAQCLHEWWQQNG